MEGVGAAASGALGAGALTDAFGGSEGLDRDAFLKLLVEQLRNQDPLNPQDNHEFIAQLATFSSLEQSMGINTRLDALMLQTAGLANSQVVGLVGQTATVKGSMVSIDGTGVGTPVGFTLDSDTASTVVSIRDQQGRVVRTMDLGARSAGLVQVNWDGRDDAGVVQPAGAYTVSVEAKTDLDAPVGVSQETSGVVEAVSFEQGFPLLHLDNGISVPVSDLLKVEPTPTTP